MGLRLFDIGSVIEFRDYVSGLVKLGFSVYDGTGKLILPPAVEDPITGLSSFSEAHSKEHSSFLSSAVEKSAQRGSSLTVRGPLSQCYCFIPARVDDLCMVLASSAFFVSTEDMRDFESLGMSRGLRPQDTKVMMDRVTVRSEDEIGEICENIHRLFKLFMMNSYEGNLSRKKYRRVKTILDLVSDFAHTTHEDRVYSLFSEAVLMLFGGDAVSVMAAKNGTFMSVHVAGRNGRAVEAMTLRTDNTLVSEMLRSRRPLICDEVIELLRLGCPEHVRSLALFPVLSRGEIYGILVVHNARFSSEEMETISQFCTMMGFMLTNIASSNVYSKHIRDMTSLNLAAAQLSPSLKDPDALYETIVEISSGLIQAEKVSLMLPEEGGQELLIKAVKGINKWIAKNISLRIGEGIAGKVFKEGRPLIIADIEKHLSAPGRPRYRTASFMSIPLKVGDETIGVLNLADKVSGEIFSEADLEFLGSLALYASIAIKGAHFYNMSEHLRTLSITDSLTGLFNRRYFDDRLFEELQRAARYDSPFSLAIFDIDDFKVFNDTEGHLAGDDVLKAIANISRESVRSIDIVARFGGEEFSVIMPQTGRDEAFLVAERVRENIIGMMPSAWRHYPRQKITVSIGIATFPADGADARRLLRNADRALFRAKLSGKNKTLLCEPADHNDEGMSFHSTRF